MHKFPITHYKTFSELPLATLNDLKFSVYIIDFNWNYLFVNDFVKSNLGERGRNLIGRNMWTEFKELANDPVFNFLKTSMERKIPTNVKTTSPLNSQKLNIIGHPLEDCYYFSSSILPDKEELIHEIRNELGKKKMG